MALKLQYLRVSHGHRDKDSTPLDSGVDMGPPASTLHGGSGRARRGRTDEPSGVPSVLCGTVDLDPAAAEQTSGNRQEPWPRSHTRSYLAGREDVSWRPSATAGVSCPGTKTGRSILVSCHPQAQGQTPPEAPGVTSCRGRHLAGPLVLRTCSLHPDPSALEAARPGFGPGSRVTSGCHCLRPGVLTTDSPQQLKLIWMGLPAPADRTNARRGGDG